MSLLNTFGAFHAAALNKTSMRDEMIKRDCTKQEIAAVSNKGKEDVEPVDPDEGHADYLNDSDQLKSFDIK